MNRLNLLISLVAVLLLAAYGNWLFETFRPDSLDPARPPRHDPDYYLEGVTATVIGPAGAPRYRLQAQRVEHFPDNGELGLTAPRLEMFRQNQGRWRITAETGRVLEQGERLRLLGAVTIDQPDTPPDTAIVLTTRDLTVLPRQDFAETDQRVIIRQARNLLTGTGMHAYLADHRLELLADARGTYVGQP